MNNPSILIILSGQIGSGKSTIATHFKKMGFTHVRLGEFFKAQAQTHGLGFVEYLHKIDQTIGEEGKAKILLKHIQEVGQTAKGIIIESAYSKPLLIALKTAYPSTSMYVVTTTANKKIRIRRVAQRNNISRQESLRLVKFWDAKRTQLGIEEIKRLSDLIVSNNRVPKTQLGAIVEQHLKTDQQKRLLSVLSKARRR